MISPRIRSVGNPLEITAKIGVGARVIGIRHYSKGQEDDSSVPAVNSHETDLTPLESTATILLSLQTGETEWTTVNSIVNVEAGSREIEDAINRQFPKDNDFKLLRSTLGILNKDAKQAKLIAQTDLETGIKSELVRRTRASAFAGAIFGASLVSTALILTEVSEQYKGSAIMTGIGAILSGFYIAEKISDTGNSTEHFASKLKPFEEATQNLSVIEFLDYSATGANADVPVKK